MGQSLSQIYMHVVFSTKERIHFIHPTVEKDIHDYMGGICKGIGCPALIINGMEDRIHMLLIQSKTIATSKMVELIKTNSSKWIKTLGYDYNGFTWQSGYGAFSVDRNTNEAVYNYILNQKDHHKQKTFKQEYLSILKRYGVEYDERYLWD